eukprot:5086813-Pyramimonas_sp.AAC.1
MVDAAAAVALCGHHAPKAFDLHHGPLQLAQHLAHAAGDGGAAASSPTPEPRPEQASDAQRGSIQSLAGGSIMPSLPPLCVQLAGS